MSSIDTTHDQSIRFTPNGEADPNPFLGRARIGDSTPIRVDPTPRATDVDVTRAEHTRETPHPGRDENVTAITPGSRLDDLVDDYKLAIVHQALAQSGGNHRRAAALIGIHRSSFTRMLHRLEGAIRDRRRAALEPRGHGGTRSD